jgi:uncharacterized protein YbjT (DUF2867 family)
MLRKDIPVCVLGRSPQRAASRLPDPVDLVRADITRIETLRHAIARAGHIIFTAGVPSGRPSTERRIKATEYDGTLNVLQVARETGFSGRLMYMTASGGSTRSFASTFLNLYKGNTLLWRGRAESAIRSSGIDYTIIRTGILLNSQGGVRALHVTQSDLPLSTRYRIARADVAEAFAAALHHPQASRATFDVVWKPGRRRETWDDLLSNLRPDS